MLDTHNHYEIAFDVPNRHREAFEDWLSGEVVAWVSHETVGYFEVFRNLGGLSPEVKFVFGFETVDDWARFVESEAHEEAVDRLSRLTADREAVLWNRASVKLDDGDETAVGDGGSRWSPDRPRDTTAVISR